MGNYEKFDAIIDNYVENHKKFGYGCKSLEMPSDRRTIRYYELLKNFTFWGQPEKFSLLDVGCGYADIIDYLDYNGCRDFQYCGIDACEPFLEFAREKYKDRSNVRFIKKNYFEDGIEDLEFDYAVSSQTFNNQYTDKEDNFELICNVIGSAFEKCRMGVSFNFVIDKVQYRSPGVAYHSVEDILKFAYSKTNGVILDNSCMPFEATCTMLKDIASDGLVFDMFKKKHKRDFDDGVFVVINKNKA